MSERVVALRSREVSEKLSRIRQVLLDERFEGALFTGQESVAWVTAGLDNRVIRGGNPGLVWALVTGDVACILTQNVEGPRIAAEEEIDALGFELSIHDWWADSPADLVAALCDPGSVFDDGGGPGVHRPDLVRALRVALTVTEQERLRSLAGDVASSLESVAAAGAPGSSELAVAGRLAGALEELEVFPSVLLVGGDDRRRVFRHPIPTHAAIERDALIVVVGVRHGLHVAASRSFSFGTVDAELAERHLVASTVEAHLVAASRPGGTWGEALQVGIDAYKDLGYPGEWRRHYQGGPIGYAVREFNPAPLLEPNAFSSEPIVSGQAVAWNPTVQGAKSEDTFLVGESTNEWLSGGPGDWPTLHIQVDDVSMTRPAIVELS